MDLAWQVLNTPSPRPRINNSFSNLVLKHQNSSMLNLQNKKNIQKNNQVLNFPKNNQVLRQRLSLNNNLNQFSA